MLNSSLATIYLTGNFLIAQGVMRCMSFCVIHSTTEICQLNICKTGSIFMKRLKILKDLYYSYNIKSFQNDLSSPMDAMPQLAKVA